MGDVFSEWGTAVLRGRPAAQPEPGAAARGHRSLRAGAAATLFVLAATCAIACAAPPTPGDPGPAASARAGALLAPSAALPPRAEVVLLADGVQIESSRRGATPEGAALARLAADLRARAWRLDRSQSDAHEALDLYASAAAAARGTPAGCDADR